MHSARQSAEFSDFCINGWSTFPLRKKKRQKESEGWMIHNRDVHQWFIDTTGRVLKIQTGRTRQERASILKKRRWVLCQWSPFFRQITAKTWIWRTSFIHGACRPFWQQPLANWSGSNPAAPRLCWLHCCYRVAVITEAAGKLPSLMRSRRRFSFIPSVFGELKYDQGYRLLMSESVKELRLFLSCELLNDCRRFGFLNWISLGCKNNTRH